MEEQANQAPDEDLSPADTRIATPAACGSDGVRIVIRLIHRGCAVISWA